MSRDEPWDVAELRALTEREVYDMISLEGKGPWNFSAGEFWISVVLHDGYVRIEVREEGTDAIRTTTAYPIDEAETVLRGIVSRIEGEHDGELDGVVETD